jgi:hydrogenase maturation protease
MKTLIYGYGNPGRQDDGLGNVMIDKVDQWLEEEGITHIETDSNYQLNIEDADAISDKDLVVFVDASIEEIDDFILTKVEPSDATIEFTMHAVSTSFVLDLCKKIYNKNPETYLIHIKGYEWDFKEGLTPKAEENLNKAFKAIKEIIKDKNAINNYLQ